MTNASEIKKITAEIEFIEDQLPDEQKGIADYKKAMKFDEHFYKWLFNQESHHLKALNKRLNCLYDKLTKKNLEKVKSEISPTYNFKK